MGRARARKDHGGARYGTEMPEILAGAQRRGLGIELAGATIKARTIRAISLAGATRSGLVACAASSHPVGRIDAAGGWSHHHSHGA